MAKRHIVIALGLTSIGMLLSTAASATSISLSNTFNFIDNRSANDINLNPGLFDTFGARVTPSDNSTITAQSTVGTATQGPRTVILSYEPFTTDPFHYVRSIQPPTLPTGQWDLSFNNNGDTATGTTPNLSGGSVIPFVSAMNISGSGAQPKFNWLLPAGTIDSQQMVIRDLGSLVGTGGIGGAGVANIVYSQSLNANSTTFTLDQTAFGLNLDLTHRYSVELDLRQLRNPTGGTGLHNTISQSRSFFDFTLSTGTLPNVYLPTVNTSNPSQTVYQFSNITAQTNIPTFIDPLLAIGYDYQIGLGDPNFASVLLPTGIGDNKFQLYLWDGSQWVFNTDLTGGQTFDFATGGVDRFRILGIETSAALDPANGLAFVTGLTWTAAGTFSGTMTPITFDVAATPLPGTLPLLASAMGALGLLGRRCRKRKAAAAA